VSDSLLVRAPNWAGDLVMSTPAFRALRAGLPDTHLALHVRPELAPLVAGAPWFDEIVPLQSWRGGVRALLDEGRALRARRFERGLCVPDSFSSALLMWRAGVGERVGFRGGGRSALLTRALVPPEAWGPRRRVARETFVLTLVEALGCPSLGSATELFTTDAEEERAAQLLARAGVGRQAFLALAPGASYGPSKLWPVESFASVGDRAARAGQRVLVLGAPWEADLCASVVASMQEPAEALAADLDLGTLKAVLRRASALVCNDAGARHVAVAFGVPCVVLFGPTSLEKTALNLERVAPLFETLPCGPCYERRCPIDHRCMRRLSPERVERALATIQPEKARRAAGNEEP
jgi:heptosyltransferase-2